jgi:hypothetical protein
LSYLGFAFLFFLVFLFSKISANTKKIGFDRKRPWSCWKIEYKTTNCVHLYDLSNPTHTQTYIYIYIYIYKRIKEESKSQSRNDSGRRNSEILDFASTRV